MGPGSEESPLPPRKRRKVAESCKTCRAKKTRCDGRRPACSSCASKGVVCEYNDVTVPVSASTLSEIEARLHRLETQASTAKSHIVARHSVVSDHLGLWYSFQTPRKKCIRGAIAHSIAEQPGRPADGALVVGLGTGTPSAGDPSSGQDTPFPDHTTTQFIQEITEVADAQPAEYLRSSLWGRADARDIETDISAMVVPNRTSADNLLECYERHFYPLFPILHMPTFRACYRQLWEPQKHGHFENLASEATFHATLNIIFALGCINNSKVEPSLKLRTSDSFYRRARMILPLDALDVPSLGVVQYLLLAANYLSFTKFSNRCWNTLGMAIRVAQTLGLHEDAEASSNQLKREMSRRVWHQCLTMERCEQSQFPTSSIGPRHLNKTTEIDYCRAYSGELSWWSPNTTFLFLKKSMMNISKWKAPVLSPQTLLPCLTRLS